MKAILLLLVLGAPAATLDGPGPSDLLDAGVRSYRAGDLDAAGRDLRRAVAQDPGLVAAHYHLAKVRLIQGDLYGSFYSLRELLALEPGMAKGPRLLMEIVGPLLKRISADLKAHRDLAQAYNVMGWLLTLRGRLDEALERQRYALRVDPRLAEAYDDLAWAYYLKRDLERAFQMSTKAFEVNPVKGSIARHYQQLYSLARLGLSTGPMTFYPPPPPPPQRQAAVAADPPSVLEIAADSGPLAGEDVLVRDYLAAVRGLGTGPLDGGPVVAGATPDPSVGPGATPAPSALAPSPRATPGATPAPGDTAVGDRLRKEYEAARALREQGQPKEALRRFRHIYSIDPGYADVAIQVRELREMMEVRETYEQALGHLRRGDDRAALGILTGMDMALLSRARGIRSVDNLIGQAAHGTRDYRLAAQALGRWLVENPRDGESRWLLVRSLMALHEWRAAEDELAQLHARVPDLSSRHPEVRGLRLRLWVKSRMALVLGVTLLWLTAAFGYTGYRLRRGASRRRLGRAIPRIQAALGRDRFAEALKYLDELGPLPATPADQVFLATARGTALVGLGEVARAQKIAEEIGRLYPGEPAVVHLLARLMLTRKETSPEAIAAYERLLAVEPNNKALLEVLNSHYQAQDPGSEAAGRILDRLLDLAPDDRSLRYYRALRFLRVSDHGPAARDAYARCLQADPQRHEVRLALMRCHYRAGEYLEVVREGKFLLEADPDSDATHEMMLSAYAHLEMLDEAHREYERFSRRHPQSMVLRQWIGRIDGFKPADSIRPDTSSRELRSLYEKGMKLYTDGRYRDAVGPLTAAFGMASLRVAAGSLLVRCYLRLRDTRMAQAVFDGLVLPERPEDFLLDVCYEIAIVHLHEGRRDRAVEILTYICRANVSYKDAFRKLEELNTRS